MSNFSYINGAIEQFNRKWNDHKVYVTEDSHVPMSSLVAFVQHKWPTANITRDTIPVLVCDYDYEDSDNVGDDDERVISKFHSTDSWTGKLDVTNIPGISIHAEMHAMPISWERKYMFLLAVSGVSVGTLVSELIDYVQAKTYTAGYINIIGEGRLPRPKYSWDDLIMPDKKKEMLRGHIDSFFKTKEVYGKMKLPYKRGMLFVGPPGNGKSLAAKVVASNPAIEFFVLPLKQNTEDKHVQHAFRSAAERKKPAVILLEDLDRFADSATSMSFLLNLLDGMRVYSGLLVLATANDPHKIDRALLHRPSRFDMIWHFDLPTHEMREKMLHKLNKNYQKFDDVTLRKVADDTEGFSMAYVQEVMTGAMLTAVYQDREVTNADLFESMKNVKEQMKYAEQYVSLKTDSELSIGIAGFGSENGPTPRGD